MKKLVKESTYYLLLISVLVLSGCKKNNLRNSASNADVFFKVTLDGKNLDCYGTIDLNNPPTPQQPLNWELWGGWDDFYGMYIKDPSGNNYRTIFELVFKTIPNSTGNYDANVAFLPDGAIYGSLIYDDLGLISVRITKMPTQVGEFLEGNFSGTIQSFTTNIFNTTPHVISGSFRVPLRPHY